MNIKKSRVSNLTQSSSHKVFKEALGIIPVHVPRAAHRNVCNSTIVHLISIGRVFKTHGTEKKFFFINLYFFVLCLIKSQVIVSISHKCKRHVIWFQRKISMRHLVPIESDTVGVFYIFNNTLLRFNKNIV